MNYSYIDLNLSGRSIKVNDKYLMPFKDDIDRFLDGVEFANNRNFAENIMIKREIKSNNIIEGIVDDLTLIDKVIQNNNYNAKDRKRIINLYKGYKFILDHKEINKENLLSLYHILSDGILEKYDLEHTTDSYRDAPVYIVKGNYLYKQDTHIYDEIKPAYFKDPLYDPNYSCFRGIDVSKLDQSMDKLFDYINSDNCDNDDISQFIKSQIIHFYFVYVHPFMDVNGRTARTTSMWYLLNNEVYPYIIFNRGVTYSKSDYENSIIAGRGNGDITLFLKYMLVRILVELEKEYVTENMKENCDVGISREKMQLLEYILSMKSDNITVKDVTSFYNLFNPKKRPSEIYHELVKPLIDRGVLINDGETKSLLDNDTHNMRLKLNKDMITIKEEKLKYLKLDRYVK